MLEYAFMGLVVVVIIFIYVWRKKQFGVNCIVFENRSNGIVPFITKAGRFQEKSGKYFYKIKFGGFPMGKVKKTKPFEFESLMIDTKGKNLLLVYSPAVDQYVPLDMCYELKEPIKMEVPVLDAEGKPVLDLEGKPMMEIKEFPKIKIKGLDEDVRQFTLNLMEDGFVRYHNRKGLMDKFGPMILVIITALALGIILYSAGDMMQSGSSLMSSAADTAAGIKGSILGQQIVIPK
jgi:hypothetical protein